MRRAIGTSIHVKKAGEALIFTNGKNIGGCKKKNTDTLFENLSDEAMEGAMRDSVYEIRQEDEIYEYEDTISTNDLPPQSSSGQSITPGQPFSSSSSSQSEGQMPAGVSVLAADKPGPVHSSSASQPVSTCLDFSPRPPSDLRSFSTHSSPPPRPSRTQVTSPSSSSCHSPLADSDNTELRSKTGAGAHISRKSSFRSSLPVATGKPSLPSSALPKSPTELLQLTGNRSGAITTESGVAMNVTKSRLTQLGVPEGSLKSHTRTISHGSTGSKMSSILETKGRRSANGDMSEEEAMAAAVAASLVTRGSDEGQGSLGPRLGDSEEGEAGECHLCGGDYYYQVWQLR